MDDDSEFAELTASFLHRSDVEIDVIDTTDGGARFEITGVGIVDGE